MKKRRKQLNHGRREPKPVPFSPTVPLQVGDRVSRVCVTLTGQDGFNAKEPARLTGRVVWIHPLERFHVVEFQLGGGIVRECFLGVEK